MVRKLKYEDVKKYIESFGYKLLSKEYINNRENLEMLCPNGNLFKCNFNKFKQSGQRCRCKECVPSHAYKYDIEYVKKYFEQYNYIVLDDFYISCREKMRIKCDKGHTYETDFLNFIKGRRCPFCSKTKKYSFEYVKEYIESFGYLLLETEYINVKTQMKVMCNKGHIYETTFDNFKSGKRCLRCKESKGEKRINELLDKYNIEHNNQYRFENCKFKYTLPFDFYLPQYNCCIEYDGQQHYKYGCFNESLLDLMEIKIKDNIKTQYCKDNNIKLIRIPYWDFDNIEEILKKELNL